VCVHLHLRRAESDARPFVQTPEGQPDEADPVLRLEIGTDAAGFGVWTISPQRENVTISPDTPLPLPVAATASTGSRFPLVAMKRDVLACPVDPVPETLKVDCPFTVFCLPCEMEPAGVTSCKAEESAGLK
jgi:hypothetical protein